MKIQTYLIHFLNHSFRCKSMGIYEIKKKNPTSLFFVLWIKIHTAVMDLFSCVYFN